MGNVSDLPWVKGRSDLALNCEAEYFPDFLTPDESTEIFKFLWRNYDLSNRTVTTADGTVYQMDTGKFMFADAGLTDFSHLPEVLGARAPGLFR